MNARPNDAGHQPGDHPGLTIAELRVRLDVLNRILTELVDRTVRADSEEAGLLRIA